MSAFHSWNLSVDDAFVTQPVFLVFHGVDTVADIVLNGYHLGRTDNMFVRYRFYVLNILQVTHVYLATGCKSRNRKRNCPRVFTRLASMGSMARPDGSQLYVWNGFALENGINSRAKSPWTGFSSVWLV